MSGRADEENQARSVQNSADETSNSDFRVHRTEEEKQQSVIEVDETAAKATEKDGRNRDNINLLEKERQVAKVKEEDKEAEDNSTNAVVSKE